MVKLCNLQTLIDGTPKETADLLILPITEEERQAAFQEIGLDGIEYTEYCITEFHSLMENLTAYMKEYENLDELNYLAQRLHSLSEQEQTIYESALSMQTKYDVPYLINLTYNLNQYEFIPDVKDREELGHALIESYGYMEVPEHLYPIIDYRAAGKAFIQDNGGQFLWDGGFVYKNNESFIEHYTGIQDLPQSPAPKFKM